MGEPFCSAKLKKKCFVVENEILESFKYRVEFVSEFLKHLSRHWLMMIT